MKLLNGIAILVMSLLLTHAVTGQDVVILKKGDPISGKLIKYELGKHVVIQTEGDTQVFIPISSVKSIVEDSNLLYGKSKKVKELKVKEPFAIDQWYFSWENKLYPNDRNSGLGISLSYLYQWKHYLAAGVGVGYDNYNFNRIRSFVPVFVQARSYIKDAHKSPYLDVKLGYGFTSQKHQQVISNEGGFYNQTSIGLRFGSGGFRTTAGIGLQFQNNQLEAFHPWNGGILRENRQYRRLVFNLGFIF